MKCLLDTHILLWTLFSPEKLKAKHRDLILDLQNDVYASVVSFWEISLKYSLGKLHLKKIKPEMLPDYVRKSDFQITKIDENLLATFYKLPKFAHKDPFDRLIIWEALEGNYTLLSDDGDFAEYKKLGLKIA